VRVIVGMSGASGAIYGIRLLEVLRSVPSVETHLIISATARETVRLETDVPVAEVEALADVVHAFDALSAPPSSGSYPVDAMVVIPCSMGTVSRIARSSNENLLARAADVTLKERRPLVLVPRESPLHLGHLRLLVEVAELGAIVCPPMPAFYHRPTSVDEIVDHTVQRVVDLLHIALPRDLTARWSGPGLAGHGTAAGRPDR
jgi:4-hydroxy-3-polyprenylbenzoate decarboxylase